jgi:hypothetical protein
MKTTRALRTASRDLATNTTDARLTITGRHGATLTIHAVPFTPAQQRQLRGKLDGRPVAPLVPTN